MTCLPEAMEMFPQEDLLEPQFYPDPVSFRESLEKIFRHEKDLKKEMASNKATLRALAPYFKILTHGGKMKIDSHAAGRKPKTARTPIVQKSKAQITSVVPNVLDKPELINSIEKTAKILKTLVRSSRFVTYLVDPVKQYVCQYSENKPNTIRPFKIEPESTMAAYSAYNKTHVTSNNIQADPRFPLGIGIKHSVMKFGLCVPIVTPNGSVVALFELTRDMKDEEFDKHDVQAILTVTLWMGVGILQSFNYTSTQRQYELSEYLQQLTLHYHCDQANLDNALSDIVVFAREAIGAERCVFYVVVERNKEWLEVEEYVEGLPGSRFLKRFNRTRLEANDGALLTTVMLGKQILNIKKGSYSALCIPVLCSCNQVTAAIKLTNYRLGKKFSSEDEEALQLFANYFSLIFHHLNSADRLSTIEVLNNATQNLLHHHIKTGTNDLPVVKKTSLQEFPKQFFTFSWYPSPDEVPRIEEMTVNMFHKVLGNSFMFKNNVPKFIATVKNCYRPNPYHNFLHAFAVTHTMANIISRYQYMFYGIERIGLMIAALCHDLDHRGYTNNFLLRTNHYLSALYPSSPLENHHFAVAKMIIEQCSMLTYLDKGVYDQLITEIYKCIVATDLALYFQTRMELVKIADKKTFTFKDSYHRRLVKSLLMTTCDLSGQAKPIDICRRITEDVYEEFYRQGDIEKKMGLTPIPAMDREQKSLFLENQIQFVNVVVLPCIETVARIFTSVTPMLDDARETLNNWTQLLCISRQSDVIQRWKALSKVNLCGSESVIDK